MAGEKIEKPVQVSAFDPEKIGRDPFQRIDAKYLAGQASVVVVPDGALEDLFRVTALSVDRLSIAVINGRAFAAHETFTVRAGDKELRTTVLKICESGVDLDCGGTLLKLPITREKPRLEE